MCAASERMMFVQTAQLYPVKYVECYEKTVFTGRCWGFGLTKKEKWVIILNIKVRVMCVRFV